MNPVFEELIKRGMKVGKGTYLDWNCVIDQSHCWLIEIGKNVTLAPNSMILAHDASMNRHLGMTKIARTRILDRAFIGAGAIILPGVTVGKNCIVGAGSVVTRDIPANTVVAGNPAQKIRSTADYLKEVTAQAVKYHVFEKLGNTVEDIDNYSKKKMIKILSKGPGFIKSK